MQIVLYIRCIASLVSVIAGKAMGCSNRANESTSTSEDRLYAFGKSLLWLIRSLTCSSSCVSDPCRYTHDGTTSNSNTQHPPGNYAASEPDVRNRTTIHSNENQNSVYTTVINNHEAF